MKTRSLQILETLILLVLVAAVPVWAQSGQAIVVNVPFEFAAGTKAFPAGEYTVKTNIAPGVLLIQSADLRSALCVITHAVEASKMQERPKLVFNRYGSHYFLSRVWPAGGSTGRQLLKSRQEVELAKGTSPPIAATLTGSARTR